MRSVILGLHCLCLLGATVVRADDLTFDDLPVAEARLPSSRHDDCRLVLDAAAHRAHRAGRGSFRTLLVALSSSESLLRAVPTKGAEK